MILPTTYLTALLLTVLTMLCWGSWANTFKLAGGKWRFELFYYDYSLGVLVTSLLIAFTFGALGPDLSFMDNFLIAGKLKIAYGLAGGLVFNLANILLVAAISVAGLAVAFPVGIGIALVVGVVWNYVLDPQGNPVFLFSGVALVMVAIILDALAYAYHARTHKPPVDEVPVPVPGQPVRRGPVKPAARSARPMKGIILSVVSGILMGSFYPLVQMGKAGENGLGPYAIGVVFAAGVFVSTFVYNVYFLNLPVQGPPIEMWQYFRGTKKQHILGIVGGAIWAVGAISNFVAASAPKEVQVGPAISYALGQGATLVSALWGLLVWKEFAGAEPGVRRLLAAMLLFFIGGLTLCSLAPLYAHR